MVRKKKELASVVSLPVSPLSDLEMSEFLNEIEEARLHLDTLKRNHYNLSPTESVARTTHLPLARKRVTQLEAHLANLRGDLLSVSTPAVSTQNAVPAKIDGRMKIQAEAYELWIRLKASGANPTIHSICDTLAGWCADNGVTTHSGVSPRAGTIRNTILGGSSGWTPPSHSRDQAKAHVAQLAQVAQPNATDPN